MPAGDVQDIAGLKDLGERLANEAMESLRQEAPLPAPAVKDGPVESVRKQ